MALVLPCLVAAAQTDGGEEAMGFSRVVRDPVSAAKGFAGTASDNNMAWAAFGNAASVPMSSKNFDAAFSFQSWAPDLEAKTTDLSLGLSYKFSDKFGATLGFARDGGKSFTGVDDSGNELDSFTPSNMMLGGGLGWRFAEKFSVGANFRYLSQKLAEGVDCSTFGVDVMAMGRFSDFTAALGVKNIGGSVDSEDGDSYDIPSSVVAAASWRKVFSEDHGLEADLDLDYFLSGNFTAAFGAEYGWKDMLFLRAGYHYGADKAVLPSFATVGLGAKFKGVRLDFAYLTANDDIGGGLTLGLGFSF